MDKCSVGARHTEPLLFEAQVGIDTVADSSYTEGWRDGLSEDPTIR